MQARYVDILPIGPFDRFFTYQVESDVPVGSYVEIPFGKTKTSIGVVWQNNADTSLKPDKIKPIEGVYDSVPPMQDLQRSFIEKMAAYTLIPMGQVLKMSIGHVDFLTDKRKARNIAVHGDLPDIIAPRQFDLSKAQEHAVVQIKQSADFSTFLLDGVTGSGKTEVYFDVVANVLQSGGQCLIMLPEIGLSDTFVERFYKRFGFYPARWHSDVTPAQRRLIWRGVANNTIKIVMGARSALFLPYPDLRLTIVDEEHDPSYKQEEGGIYNARDMAVMRAALNKSTVVLASATPSLESVHNMREGRYTHIHLPDRHAGSDMAAIELVDMREHKCASGDFISDPLFTGLQETVQNGQQALLFLNRRGYAPLTLCRTCGHRLDCPRCTAWLIEHRHGGGQLHCHHCEYTCTMPKKCPSCSDSDSMVPIGPGIERLEEEIMRRLPKARVMVLSSDLHQDKGALADALAQIHEGGVDIVIGTQILAKGHHFKNLALVGVVDGDAGLSGGDLRAGERTYQLLHQVAGRAGREKEIDGVVMIQSFNPDHPIMQAMVQNGRDTFVSAEMSAREAGFMPPFSRLAAIIVSSRDEKLARETSKMIIKALPADMHERGIECLGPSEAPLFRLRGAYRFRLLLIADKGKNMQKFIKNWLKSQKISAKVKIHVDIDPQSFL